MLWNRLKLCTEVYSTMMDSLPDYYAGRMSRPMPRACTVGPKYVCISILKRLKGLDLTRAALDLCL